MCIDLAIPQRAPGYSGADWFDLQRELQAYRWRLYVHKEAYLQAGQMQEYQNIQQKLGIIAKWSKS